MLRRDHIAGGVIVAVALAILAASGELPFGTLASPGAGMLPKLVIGLMIVFGLLIALRAGASPALADLDWSDLPHALRVLIVAVAAIAGYTTLGFLLTMTLMLFALTYIAERQGLWASLAFSIIVPAVTFALFEYLLKTPLEYGILRF